jgi:hypothetical protein
MIVRVLDPTHELKAAGVKSAARLSSLEGKTVGFISNGKEGTKSYFAQLERMLREDFGVADVVGGLSRITARRRTPTSSTRRGDRTLSSLVLAIEAVVHRAVCTTQSQLSGKGYRPWAL